MDLLFFSFLFGPFLLPFLCPEVSQTQWPCRHAMQLERGQPVATAEAKMHPDPQGQVILSVQATDVIVFRLMASKQ